MSVLVLPGDEIARAANSVLFHGRLRHAAMIGERSFTEAFYDTEEEYEQVSIIALFDRLHCQNQVCFEYNYANNADFVVNVQRIPDLPLGAMLQTKELRDALRLLEYNLYTNAGRCFGGADDLKRLQNISRALDQEIIEDRI